MRNLPKIFLRSFENVAPAVCIILQTKVRGSAAAKVLTVNEKQEPVKEVWSEKVPVYWHQLLCCVLSYCTLDADIVYWWLACIVRTTGHAEELAGTAMNWVPNHWRRGIQRAMKRTWRGTTRSVSYHPHRLSQYGWKELYSASRLSLYMVML